MKNTCIAYVVPAVLAASAFTSAQAATFSVGNYTGLFQGIDETTATIQGGSGTSQAYVVRVDLAAPGVSFTTTAGASGDTSNAGTSPEVVTQTTSQFLKSTGSQVAINTNFFSCPCVTNASNSEYLLGLEISNGKLVSSDQSGYSSLLLTQNNQASLVAGGSVANTSGIHNAVSGGGFVLQNGLDVVNGTIPGDPLNPNPRSVAGLSQNGEYLYLMAIDGRQAGYSVGVTQAEEADLMSALGAWNAINFDGGGSTALVVQGADGSPDVLNRPSGGAERYDGANLGIYAAPLPTPLPPALALFGSGLLSLLGFRRRKPV